MLEKMKEEELKFEEKMKQDRLELQKRVEEEKQKLKEKSDAADRMNQDLIERR
jgi:hypothetical protein